MGRRLTSISLQTHRIAAFDSPEASPKCTHPAWLPSGAPLASQAGGRCDVQIALAFRGHKTQGRRFRSEPRGCRFQAWVLPLPPGLAPARRSGLAAGRRLCRHTGANILLWQPRPPGPDPTESNHPSRLNPTRGQPTPPPDATRPDPTRLDTRPPGTTRRVKGECTREAQAGDPDTTRLALTGSAPSGRNGLPRRSTRGHVTQAVAQAGRPVAGQRGGGAVGRSAFSSQTGWTGVVGGRRGLGKDFRRTSRSALSRGSGRPR
jgi:hypothetical protein